MQVREHTPGEEERLIELLPPAARRSFLATWRWRAPRAAIAFDGERPVGFAAAHRQRLIVNGEGVEGAQLGPIHLTGDQPSDELMLRCVEAGLASEGVGLVLAATTSDQLSAYAALGYAYLFEVAARNLYIGLEALSARLSKTALSPLRRFAKEARRIRPKLNEVPLDAVRTEQLARLSITGLERRSLAVAKSAEYLAWRYGKDPRHVHRAFAYRQRAGQGVDAFVIVRKHVSPKGRAVLHVEDHWTREPGRRAQAKLMGDVAILGLTEDIDVLRCFAAAGSSTEQALLSIGCIRKKVERVIVAKRILETAPPMPSPFPSRDVALASGDLDLYPD